MLRQMELEVQIGPITMNGLLPATALLFFENYVSVSTSRQKIGGCFFTAKHKMAFVLTQKNTSL